MSIIYFATLRALGSLREGYISCDSSGLPPPEPELDLPLALLNAKIITPTKDVSDAYENIPPGMQHKRGVTEQCEKTGRPITGYGRRSCRQQNKVRMTSINVYEEKLLWTCVLW